MGYYTDFALSAEPIDSTNKPSRDRIKSLEEEVECMNDFGEFSNYDDGWFVTDKWYYYERDMYILSKKFPEFLFYLEGKGESSDDFWGCYFLDGKVMRDAVRIVWEKFDPERLEPAEHGDSNKYSYQK